MNTFQKVEVWGDTHQTKWLALLRVLLGLVIFFKGLYFVQNTDALHQMLANSRFDLYSLFFAHWVALAQLVGGFLIVIGLLTRAAVLVQIPIVLGAIIFVNASRGFYSIHSELGLSLLIFCLLCFFLVFGSGKFSVDEFMRTHVNT